MNAAWIPLTCPACGETWEGEPSALPAPGNDFGCPYCGDRRPVAEFVKTSEGLRTLEAFYR